jgi:AAA family ATP:ADP antiporter
VRPAAAPGRSHRSRKGGNVISKVPQSARWRPAGRAIRAQFLVAEGESGPALYFLGLFFVLGTGFALGRGSAGSLFVQRFGVGYLPHAYAALAATIALASFAYAAVADRVRPDRLLAALLAALAALLVPLWAAMAWSGIALAYPAYFVAFHALSEILLLQAMLYFAMSFDNAQSKRLLPIALAGLQAGEMGGGLGLTALASRVPMQHVAVLWCAFLALAAGLVLARHLGRGHAPHMSPARRSSRPWRAAAAQVAQGMRFSRSSPLLRNLALATLFMVVAVHVLEFASFVIYARAFRTEEELGIVFGLLTFTCGATTLLVQLFFSGKLLRRYGVRAMNLAFPLGLLAAFAALAAGFRVHAALAGSFAHRTLMPAMRNPSRALLFQALPDHMQGRARALSLAVVMPVGILLAATAARAVPPAAQAWLLPLAGLAAAAGYLLFSVATNRAYPAALLDTLGERLFVARGHLGRLDPLRDRAFLEKLAEGLRHSDDEVALAYAHALAEAMPAEAWRPIVMRARGANPAARDRMVRLVAGQMPAAQRSMLRELVDTGDHHQRATLLSTLFAARDPDSRDRVEKCLASDNPRLVACGIQGAHDYAIEALLPAARAQWRQLLESPLPARRMAGLDLARARPEPKLLGLVLEATGHADARVRGTALATIAQYADIAGGALVDWVRTRLSSAQPDERATALRCATDLPEAERLACAQAALGDAHPRVSAAAVQLLADHHGPAFADAAFDLLADDSLPLRAQRALLAWLLDNAAPQRRIAGYAMRRSQEALALATTLQRLRCAPPEREPPWTRSLLATALEERAIECADLALLALEALEDETTVARIRAAVTSRDARHLARAVEAMEGLRQHETGLALRRTLESLRGDAPLDTPATAGPETFAQIVDYLSQYPDALLRECARCGQRLSAGEAAA